MMGPKGQKMLLMAICLLILHCRHSSPQCCVNAVEGIELNIALDEPRGGVAPLGARIRLRGGGPKKAKQAVKKIVDDKTFGIKNKNKSKKVQSYVKQVETAAKNSFVDKKSRAENDARKKRKEEAKQWELEIGSLIKPVESKQKSTKELMEDYEYQTSIQALGKTLNQEENQNSLEVEVETLRAKLTAEEKEPIDFEWFQEWVEEEQKRKAKAQNKLKNTPAMKQLRTGKQIFLQGSLTIQDDSEADEEWAVRQPSDELERRSEDIHKTESDWDSEDSEESEELVASISKTSLNA